MKAASVHAFLAMAALVSGCVMEPVQPLTSDQHSYGREEDETKLIKRAADLDDELRRRNLLLEDRAVNAYIRSVGERLVPPRAASAVSFQFQVVRDPVVNAFALPNGSIYLTVGMLARLENEAQLAHVLSHEIAHVVQRHGLQQLRNRRATIVAAHIADLALFGTAIAYLPAIGSLAQYSQENEAEADQLALDYLTRAGYSLEGAEQLFRVLQEIKQKESIWGSIYSSHPDNADRMRVTRQRIDSMAATGGRVGQPEYGQVRDRLLVENLQLKLNVRQYELTVDAADRALRQGSASPWFHYYRGEACRLMAEDPTGAAREHAWIHDKKYNSDLVETYRGRKPTFLATAKTAFQQALAQDKTFVTAYRGLGLVAHAEGDNQAARTALNHYLAQGRGISDRRYIEAILGRINTP
jgi:predicted Zn-dependent protease